MKIKHSDFENGGEVDYGAWHYDMVEVSKDFKRRVGYSLRLRRKDGEERVYEVYKRLHTTKEEKVTKEGTLEQCVAFINKNYDYADEVV